MAEGYYRLCWRPKAGGALVTQFFKDPEAFRRFLLSPPRGVDIHADTVALQEELDRHGSQKEPLDADF